MLSLCAIEMKKEIEKSYVSLPKNLRNEKDSQKIIERYFGMKDPQFVKEVEKLAKDVDLAGRPETIIIIPVTAYGEQEKETTEKITEVFTNQTVKPLIIFFCNKPFSEKWDSIPEILEENGGKVIRMDMRPEKVRAGGYRELMQAIILMSALEAGYDPIQISLDVDTLEVSSTLVETYIRGFDELGVDAIIGQLDWDNSKIRTRDLPAFLIGSEMMRLLPKYGNWSLINRSSEIPIEVLEECIFSPLSFGRGVQANLTFRSSSYARVGGYDSTQYHDEFDYILRMIAISGNLKNIRKLWEPVRVVSDSRRALWAFAEAGLPPMRQWSEHSFKTVQADKIRTSLPEISTDKFKFNLLEIQKQINLTLEVFNLPMNLLKIAIERSMEELNFEGKYSVEYYPLDDDPVLFRGKVKLK